MKARRRRFLKVHLIDGTFELFRAYYGGPPARSKEGREVGATRTLLRSLNALLREVTHVAIAFDTVIESFRNELFAGYKTGEGMDPDLYQQFPLAEEAARALGIAVWSMIEFEADDGLASGAAQLVGVPEVEQIVLCSPDKDLAQCVSGRRVVTWDRMRGTVLDEEGVVAKFGVSPESIPDLLALVGDTADGIPGIPRWGMKSASTVLAHYRHLEAIPDDAAQWEVKVRGAQALASELALRRGEAELYRRLATLRTDAPVDAKLFALEWRGARRDLLPKFCEEIGDRGILERVTRWRD